MKIIKAKGESTKAHWNAYWQKDYHQIASRLPPYERILVESACRLTHLAGKKLLEIGCGSGRNSLEFIRRGATVFVADFSRPALKLVQQDARLQGLSIHLVEADASKLPLQTDTFDLIYHSGFLEHFTNPLEILREQIRLLKPGGYILVDVPQKFTIYTLKKHYAMRKGTWYAGWETEYSPGELKSLLQEAGLEIIDMYARGIALSYGWTARAALLKLRQLLHRNNSMSQNTDHQQSSTPNASWKRLRNRILLYTTDSIGAIGRKPSFN